MSWRSLFGAAGRGHEGGDPLPPPQVDDPAVHPEHVVQFYRRTDELARHVVPYLAEGLRRGESAIVLVTTAHWDHFAHELEARGLDVPGLAAEGRLYVLDAHQTLRRLYRGGQVDARIFDTIIGEARRTAAAASPRIRAYGELVDVLWRAGNPEAAVQLETLWNRFLERHPMPLYCAYELDPFAPGAARAAEAFAGTHRESVVLEDRPRLEGALRRALVEHVGAPDAQRLWALATGGQDAGGGLERMLSWLRQHMPGDLEPIQARARLYAYVDA